MRASDQIRKLEEIRQNIAESVLTTPCADYAAYLKMVGKYEGLGAAIIEIQNQESEEEA